MSKIDFFRRPAHKVRTGLETRLSRCGRIGLIFVALLMGSVVKPPGVTAQSLGDVTATWNSSERRMEFRVTIVRYALFQTDPQNRLSSFNIVVDGTTIIYGNYSGSSTIPNYVFDYNVTTNTSRGNLEFVSTQNGLLRVTSSVTTINYYPDVSHLDRNIQWQLEYSVGGTQTGTNNGNVQIYNPIEPISWSNVQYASHGANYDYDVAYTWYPELEIR